MTKNQSAFFRFLLFLAGAGIIVLAFFLLKGDRELTTTDAFIWISIGVMYLVFFLPFFFSSINIGNFSGKIPTLPLVWGGVVMYIAASAGIILLLVYVDFFSLNIAIIVQSIVFFLFILNVYFAYFASSHVGNVAAEEATKLALLNRIKPKAAGLSLSVDKLPAQYGTARQILKRTVEDIKYVYPVDGGAGGELESKILRSLDILSELCGSAISGAHPASLEQEAETLNMLVKERKLLKNQ